VLTAKQFWYIRHICIYWAGDADDNPQTPQLNSRSGKKQKIKKEDNEKEKKGQQKRKV